MILPNPDLPGHRAPREPAGNALAEESVATKSSLPLEPGRQASPRSAGSFSAKEVIGRNIRKHRERCGLSYMDIWQEAAEHGVTMCSVFLIECGKSEASRDQIDLFAAIFGIAPAELMDGVGWEHAG